MTLGPKHLISGMLISLMLLVGHVNANDFKLVDAMQHQQKAAVKELLTQGVDVNAYQLDGTTALQWAAYHNDLESAKLLLNAGANPNIPNDYGMLPMLLAARNGSAAMLETLLNGGAEPNLTFPTGETPLMSAAMTGTINAVEILLKNGADTNLTETTRGQTALMWATSEEHIETVRLLLAYGADIHASSYGNFTTLMFAARSGNIELARLLLSHGANVNATAQDGASVLHIATIRGHSKLATFLLEQGSDPNADAIGYTALHWASGTWESSMTYDYPVQNGEWSTLGGIKEGRLEFINTLISYGADPNARITKSPTRFGNSYGTPPVIGATPFFLAAQATDTDTMRLLLDHGADPMLNADGNTTPLMAASMMYRQTGSSRIDETQAVETVELCLMLGNDINASNKSGDTALHAVVHYGWPLLAEFLLENGANPSPINAKGQTPLRNALGVISSAMFREQPAVAAVLKKFDAIAPEVELECGVCPESGTGQPLPPEDHKEDDNNEDTN